MKRGKPTPPKRFAPANKYDAGGNGRRIASWRPPASGPNVAADSAPKVRDRARDAGRNDWGGRSATQKWVTTIVGIGITPRWKRLPEGPVRQAVADLWEDWSAVADADGVLNFYGLQTLAVRSWLESGEVFVRLRPRQLGSPLPVPLQVQLLESDFVPRLDATTWPGLPQGNEIRAGIERNRYGQRVAYWMYRAHPGDKAGLTTPTSDQLLRVPARQVLHIFEPDRPGALRGVSHLAPVLTRLRNSGDLEDTVLDRQKLANMFVAWITRAMPPDTADIAYDSDTGLPAFYDPAGRPVTTLEPGTTQDLMPGESVVFSNPPEAGVSHSDYMRTVNMGTAAGGGIPYELYSGDIRGVSDRVLRVLVLEFRRFAEQRQWQIVIPQLCQRVVEEWARAALLDAKIGARQYDAVRRVEWAPHGFEHIHPIQDPQGKILEINAGLRSRSSVIGARGDDRAAVDQERADDAASEERHNLQSNAPLA